MRVAINIPGMLTSSSSSVDIVENVFACIALIYTCSAGGGWAVRDSWGVVFDDSVNLRFYGPPISSSLGG